MGGGDLPAQFPQEDCATKLPSSEDALRREHCSNDGEIKLGIKTYLEPIGRDNKSDPLSLAE